MITLDDVLTTSGKHPERPRQWPPSAELLANGEALAHAVTLLLTAFGRSRSLTSGYRPPVVNASTPGAAAHSLHELCEAGDIADNDRALARFVVVNVPLLERIGLWCEDPRYTWKKLADGTIVFWLHVQLRPPPSGRRFFVPFRNAIPLELGAK